MILNLKAVLIFRVFSFYRFDFGARCGRDWSGSLAQWGLWFFVGRRRLTKEAHVLPTKTQPPQGNYKRKARPPPKK